jgi:hypothetical protein
VPRRGNSDPGAERPLKPGTFLNAAAPADVVAPDSADISDIS